MSSQLLTGKRVNTSRCTITLSTKWSKGGVNHKQLSLQWVPTGSQQQAKDGMHKKLYAIILRVCRHCYTKPQSNHNDLGKVTVAVGELLFKTGVLHNNTDFSFCRGRTTMFLHQCFIQIAFCFHFSKVWLCSFKWWYMNPTLEGDKIKFVQN